MTETSRVGKTLASKYRLDEELGRGGMGEVYRAFHVLVHKEFAVKVLVADLTEERKMAKRFLLEAQAAGRIGHPGILEVYDVGEDDEGHPFLVMELLRGEPLSSLVARGPIGVDEACWIAIQMLDALAAAHGAGVIHRDVKPQNVFLVVLPDGRRAVKLLDFGVAKFKEGDAVAITKSGEIIGSPLYMAPEQAKGEPDIDARVDVWSVGATLFQMLTGVAAHIAATPVAVLARILTTPAPPPSSRRSAVPPELDAVVQRAMEIDRDARFPSASAMADALRALREAAGTAGVVPVFAELPRVRVGDARAADTGIMTSTVQGEAPSSTPSKEPPFEAAVTNGKRAEARTRPIPLAAGLAAAALGAIAVLAFVWRPGPRAPAAASVPASAPASVSLSVPASASVPVPAPASLPGSASASQAAVSATACGPGEVRSLGHCCPRGLVWHSGRCDRPLATSF